MCHWHPRKPLGGIVWERVSTTVDTPTNGQTHKTFKDYCRGKWEMSRRQANRLIGAAGAVEVLGPVGPTPTTERQARPLTSIEDPGEQREVWDRVVVGAVASDGSGGLTLD
jgi:hypothetical protein